MDHEFETNNYTINMIFREATPKYEVAVPRITTATPM